MIYKKLIPSSPPKLESIALSGWGIIPNTLPLSLKIPAILFIETLILLLEVKFRTQKNN